MQLLFGQKYWQLCVRSLTAAQKAHMQRSTCAQENMLGAHCKLVWVLVAFLPSIAAHGEPIWGQARPKARTTWIGYRLGHLGKSPGQAAVAKLLSFSPFPSSETSCGTSVLPTLGPISQP